MAKFGKWVGLGLGWALGGPIGGILGLAVGSIFDTGTNVTQGQGRVTFLYDPAQPEYHELPLG